MNERIDQFSKNASDLYKIAVNVAGFDAFELMREIHRRSPTAKVSARTVETAMGRLQDGAQVAK